PMLSALEPFRRRDGEDLAVLKSLQLGNEIESSGHNRQRVESHGYSDQPAPRAYFPIQRKRDNQRQDQQRVNQSPEYFFVKTIRPIYYHCRIGQRREIDGKIDQM